MKLSQHIAYFTVPLPQPRTVTVLDYLGSELPWLYPQDQTDSRPLDVNTWADWVNTNAQLLIEDVRKWEVVRVEWWKAPQGVQHEYLVLHLRHSEESHTRQLRLERRPQEKRDLRKRFVVGSSNRHVTTFKQRRFLRTALRQEADALTRRQAREATQGIFNAAFTVRDWDTVTETLSETGQLVGDEHQQPARLVAAYSNFCQRLTLPEAAQCAALTSRTRSGLNDAALLGRCYWYCRTIAGIIVANYQPDVEVQGEAFNDRGKFVWANAERRTLTLNTDDADKIALLARRLCKGAERDALNLKRKQEWEKKSQKEFIEDVLARARNKSEVYREEQRQENEANREVQCRECKTDRKESGADRKGGNADREERRQERKVEREEQRQGGEVYWEERRREREAYWEERRQEQEAYWEERRREQEAYWEERRREQEAYWEERRREREAYWNEWHQEQDAYWEERRREREAYWEERRQEQEAYWEERRREQEAYWEERRREREVYWEEQRREHECIRWMMTTMAIFLFGKLVMLKFATSFNLHVLH